MKDKTLNNILDNVKITKQRKISIPSQKIDEIKKIFLWTERPINELEETYKEYADNSERNAIRILGGERLGRFASSIYYIRYIDETIIEKVTELEKQLVEMFSEIEKIIVPEKPGFMLFKNKKQKILTDIEEANIKKKNLEDYYNKIMQSVKDELRDLINEKRIQSVSEFNSSKTPIMRYISDPVLSDDFVNGFQENKKNIFNGKPNLFASFFDIDPAYKYIVSKRELAKEINYNLRLTLDKDYRDVQATKKLVTKYSKLIEEVTKAFSGFGYMDTKYIILPIFLYMTDMVLHLKTTKSHSDRSQELLELQSYILYNYYDYKQYVTFNKIANIWTQILTQKNYARGDWWIGNRTLHDEENQNILFQFVLLTGDLIFQPSLIENYYDAPKYIVDVKTATDMSEILTKQILPLVDEYLNKIA